MSALGQVVNTNKRVRHFNKSKKLTGQAPPPPYQVLSRARNGSTLSTTRKLNMSSLTPPPVQQPKKQARGFLSTIHQQEECVSSTSINMRPARVGRLPVSPFGAPRIRPAPQQSGLLRVWAIVTFPSQGPKEIHRFGGPPKKREQKNRTWNRKKNFKNNRVCGLVSRLM